MSEKVDLLAALQASVDRARAAARQDFPRSPQSLRAEADRIESQQCTGVAAVWCPVHGQCICPDREDQNEDACPLHSSSSSHAAALPT